MDWLRNAGPADVAIAASFGDSIGRAEYNSRHLSTISPTVPTNVHGLVHPSLTRECLRQAQSDVATAWLGEENSPLWVRAELDMQENYMRRMICHAMDYVRQFCNLHQAFTSEKLVSYVWSLSPQCRTDQTYDHLLKDLDPRLHSLPWARTGVALDGTVEPDSTLMKMYHRAGDWLRQELRPRLESLVFSKDLYELGVLNAPAVGRLWKRWLREPDPGNRRGEIMAKIAGLELARRRFSLQPCRHATPLRDALAHVPRLVLKGAKMAVSETGKLLKGSR